MKKRTLGCVCLLVLSAFIVADAATYTLNKYTQVPPRWYVWGEGTNWSPNGVPGTVEFSDDVIIPAPSGTKVQLPDVIDLGGQSYTVNSLKVSGRNNGYTFTNGTIIANRIIEGDGNDGKSLFSANVRLTAQSDQLLISGVGSDPDDMWFYGVIGDGVGGGDFSVNLFMNPAETRQYRPWNFYGSSTYLGGTVVSNYARFVTGIDSVTNGVGQIVSGPAGRGPVFLTDNGFFQSSSSSRILHNPLFLSGECGFGTGFVLANTNAAAPTKLTLLSDTFLSLVGGTYTINYALDDGGSGYGLTVLNANAGTLNLQTAGTLAGRLSVLGGFNNKSTTLNLNATDAYAGSGGLVADWGGLVNINAAQGYTGGTAIWDARPGTGDSVQPTVSVSASGTLGANASGNDIALRGGKLSLSSPSNIGANQKIILDSLAGSMATLVLSTAFDAIPSFESGPGGGCIAPSKAYNSLTDLGTLGNGRLFLGSAGNYTFQPASFAPGAGNVYRLGGGAGTLTVATPLTDAAGTDLLIGAPDFGNGTVILSSPVSITGDVFIRGGILVQSNGTRLPSGTLILSGSPTPALGVGTWNAAGGTLQLGRVAYNDPATVLSESDGNAGCIGNSSTVRLHGGTLSVNAQNAAVPSAEIFGELAVGGEFNTVSMVTPNAASSLEVTVGKITRDNALRGALEVGVGSLGSNRTLRVSDTSTLGLSGGTGSRGTDKPIIPWMDVKLGANPDKLLPATCGVDGVLTNLNTATDFVTNPTAANADGNDNIYYDYTVSNNNVSISLPSGTVFNSLVARYDNADKSVTFGPSGATLGIKSGVVLTYGTALTYFDSTVDFGAAEAMVNCKGSEFRGGIITTNGFSLQGGATSFKSANPSLTGPVTINGGTLSLNHDQALSSSGDLVVNGGINGGRVVVFKRVGCARLTAGGGEISFSSGSANDGSSLTVGDYAQRKDGSLTIAAGGELRVSGRRVRPDCDLDVGVLNITRFGGGLVQFRPIGGKVIMDIVDANAYDMILIRHPDFYGYSSNIDFGSTGSELQINLGYQPAVGQLFKLTNIEGKLPITGKFSNGDTVQAVYADRYRATFTIHYNSSLAGADGNEIVLECTDVYDKISASVLVVR